MLTWWQNSQEAPGSDHRGAQGGPDRGAETNNPLLMSQEESTEVREGLMRK